jgi:hypothetical protein
MGSIFYSVPQMTSPKNKVVEIFSLPAIKRFNKYLILTAYFFNFLIMVLNTNGIQTASRYFIFLKYQ